MMWFEKKITIKCQKDETKFPIEILNQWDITDLEIIGGQFTYFPEYIKELKHLQKFSLTSSKVSEIPIELFQLPKLRYLNLKNNEIKNLPKLSSMTKIHTILLGRNHLTNIDSILPCIENCEVLDIGHNHFEEISRKFIHLFNIKRINLENNQLTVLPKVLKELPDLNHISLNGNPFNKYQQELIAKTFNINF